MIPFTFKVEGIIFFTYVTIGSFATRREAEQAFVRQEERLMTMVPEMPTMISKLTEDKVQQVLNIFVTVQEDNSYDVSNRIGAGEGLFRQK